jgi:hypothetical protein
MITVNPKDSRWSSPNISDSVPGVFDPLGRKERTSWHAKERIESDRPDDLLR